MMSRDNTKPGGETGHCGCGKVGDLAANYRNTPRVFDSDMSLENDRLRLKDEANQEEIQAMRSVIMGLLAELDQGELS